jgi:hypothetical protein
MLFSAFSRTETSKNGLKILFLFLMLFLAFSRSETSKNGLKIQFLKLKTSNAKLYMRDEMNVREVTLTL